MRRKFWFIIGLVATVNLSCLLAYGEPKDFIQPCPDAGGYRSWLRGPNKDHLGHDYNAPAGTKVRAIADGTVWYVGFDISGFGSEGKPGPAIWIRHRLANGKYFYALYGHIKPSSDVQKGAEIKSGQIIGTVIEYRDKTTKEDISHLHLGIWNSESEPPLSKMGYGPIRHFTNPVRFLRENKPCIKKAVTYRPRKTAPISAGETIKEFYSAVNKKNYSAAKNYLSSGLLAVLEKHPVSVGQGIKSALDAVAAGDILEKITILNESEHSMTASQAKRAGVRELEEKGGKLYDVRYELSFKPPLNKLLGKEQRSDTLIEENGICKITKFSDEIIMSSNEKRTTKFIVENLVAKLCEYEVVDVSHSPSHSEGWTDYEFDIVIKNTSTDLVNIHSLTPRIYVLSNEQRLDSSGYSAFRASKYGYRYSGSFLPSGCFIHYRTGCLIPSRVSQVDFYVVTPDLRYLDITAQGLFSLVPKFSPKSENTLVLGEPFVAEDYWEITPLGLTVTENPDELRLWVKMKNLSLRDGYPNSALYFQLLDNEGHSQEIELLEMKAIPPLFEKIRCFEEEIKKRKNYALLVGILDPNRRNEDSKKLLAYKIYRFEAQPTLETPNVTIEEVKGEWSQTYGSYYLRSIIVRIRNNADLPTYVYGVRATRGVHERYGGAEKWVKPNEKITVSVPSPLSGAGGNIEIKAITLDQVIPYSWQADP